MLEVWVFPGHLQQFMNCVVLPVKWNRVSCCLFLFRATSPMDVREGTPLLPIHGSCRTEFLMTPVPTTLPRISSVQRKMCAETANLRDRVLPCRTTPRYAKHSKLCPLHLLVMVIFVLKTYRNSRKCFELRIFGCKFSFHVLKYFVSFSYSLASSRIF